LKRRDTLTALLAAFVVLGSGGHDRGVPAVLANPVDVASNEIAVVAAAAAATARGRPPGVATSGDTGDAAMHAWRDDGSYEWVGYYLQAPCHRDASWSGKREVLSQMGWGVAVVYVGQQTWGSRTPGKNEVVTKYVKRRVRQVQKRGGKTVVKYLTKRVAVPIVVEPRANPGTSCSASYVSAARGQAEGDDAIARAAAEGFPRGTVVFLDIEHMNTIPSAMRDYYKAWTARVLADGRYRPGFYAHTANAAVIYGEVKAVYDSLGANGQPPFWVAGNTTEFSRGKAPTDVGHAFAAVWQGVLDHVEKRNGHKLPIDVNVAATPSPSMQISAD
jgi:hypothetical protein